MRIDEQKWLKFKILGLPMSDNISGSKSIETSANDSWLQLWSNIKSGDQFALSELYCCSYSQLFNYGFKIIPDQSLVEDCIQQLFLNVWKKRDVVSDAKSVKSYLFTSYRRLIFRRLKKQRNQAKRNHRYSQHQNDKIPTREELIIFFETEQHKKTQLQTALDSLSNRQRQAIYLKYYNGLSNKEISEVMDVNTQSVYNHISKAIQKMQGFVQV